MSENSSTPSVLNVFSRLFAATIITVGLAIILTVKGPPFFKWYEAQVDLKNPIGFSVITLLSILSQILVWSLPIIIPTSLVRPLIKCIGAWFSFALRLAFLVIFMVLLFLLDRLVIREVAAAGLDEARNGLIQSFKSLFGILTLDIVERLADQRYYFIDNIYSVIAYFLFLLFMSSLIRKVFLPEKSIKFKVVVFMLFSVTVICSFLFQVTQPYFPKEWKSPIFMTSFWIIDTVVTPLQIFRVMISWLGYMFCVLILQQISKDKVDEIPQIVSPVFERPY